MIRTSLKTLKAENNVRIKGYKKAFLKDQSVSDGEEVTVHLSVNYNRPPSGVGANYHRSNTISTRLTS